MNKIYYIEASSSMTRGAFFVDTIEGKDLYSLRLSDVMEFDNRIDAELKACALDTEKIIHTVHSFNLNN